MRFLHFLLLFLAVCITGTLFSQPYYDTHVVNPLVSDNAFIKAIPDTSDLPVFDRVRELLPQPEFPSHPDFINCYWKAWELAFGNLHKPVKGSGFVTPFIDPAFNGHIFMWDTHFMLLFGRYGARAFNFQQSLDNFYAKQHKDGYICREIVESDGSDFFERFDVSSTGPNLFPWTEWEYFLNFNDKERLTKVFSPLLAYYQWFNTYRSWPDGTYFSSGWGCGMDNQPRLPAGFSPEWSHGKMSWIDISLQQVLAAKLLVNMAEILGRDAEVIRLRKEIESLTALINKDMWNPQTSFYYDRFEDGSLSEVKSIASYWALIAGVVPPEKVKSFVAHLENPGEFARQHRVATLSADHPDFNPDGGYWRGSIWAPTNYMVLRGLTKYGLDSLACEIAMNHLQQVAQVYSSTGTLFENYAPDKVQGNDRKDFVGWTGIVPISVLFEYVFGLRPDVPAHKLIIDVRLLDEYAVTNYPYGQKGKLDIKVGKRQKLTDVPKIQIVSDMDLEIHMKWQSGSKIVKVHPTAGKTITL